MGADNEGAMPTGMSFLGMHDSTGKREFLTKARSSHTWHYTNGAFGIGIYTAGGSGAADAEHRLDVTGLGIRSFRIRPIQTYATADLKAAGIIDGLTVTLDAPTAAIAQIWHTAGHHASGADSLSTEIETVFAAVNEWTSFPADGGQYNADLKYIDIGSVNAIDIDAVQIEANR